MSTEGPIRQQALSQTERCRMREANINVELSLQILGTLNQGGFESAETGAKSRTAVENFQIPEVDGRNIVDFSSGLNYCVSNERLRKLRDQYPELERVLKPSSGSRAYTLNEAEIAEIGLLLSPYFAFGLLNGGSASSYFDRKKNQSFAPELFSLFESEFEVLARDFAQLPKALCPAFASGSGAAIEPGPSFMGLKLRSLLHKIRCHSELSNRLGLAALPSERQPKFFQMTSELTQVPLQRYLRQEAGHTGRGWRNDPADLESLAAELGWLPEQQVFSEKQPLIATFEPVSAGQTGPTRADRWRFFRNRDGDYLPMPGGHGQCFFALRQLLQQLYRQGTRYISLGNIDNIAYNLQPGFLGLLALSGCEGLFACSYRSPLDIKGGVLLRTGGKTERQTTGSQKTKLNCFDIGVGVDKEILQAAQNLGKGLLFNCAIGYFNLEALLQKIDHIIEHLPLRISEQNKDQGHYWQVEQVAWEVIGLLDSVLIGAVHKEEHFLAAKLQLEAFVNTGYQLEGCHDTSGSKALQEFIALARHFAPACRKVLARDCALQL